jgi:outer membrane murein-binding lipoprotein Lpp
MPKKIIFASILAVWLAAGFTAIARAQDVSNTVSGLNDTVANVSAFNKQVNGTTYDANFIASRSGQIVGVVLSFVGVIFLGLMIYAGIMWMTAQGNEQQVTKAKDLITNSIIGIVIVFAAYALTVFIGQNFLQ